MKEKIKFWIDFLKDKRFGWKFKICNFITNDYLRNYLAVGVGVPLTKISGIIDSCEGSDSPKNHLIRMAEFELDRVKRHIDDIYEL